MDPKTLDPADAMSIVRRLSRRAALASGAAGFGGLALAGASTVLAADATPAAGAGMEGAYVVTRTRVVAAGKSVDDLTAQVRAGLVPIIMQIPGFIEYFIVQNPDTRQRTAVSIFKDKTGADASTAKATDFLKTHNLAGYYENVNPVVTEGALILFAGHSS